jgi:serine/threonine protein kinase
MLKIPDRYGKTGKTFSGGYGEVHVLHDSFLDREVVLKIIKDVSDRDQLQTEVVLMSEIHSKHVLRIYDLILDDKGVLGIIEEYIPGKDLTQHFAENVYTPDSFMKLAYQIASGLCDVHKHDIVHRDVKLNNMKLDSEGIIKLFDFGLSCVNNEHITIVARGTMAYRAPELYTPPLKIENPVDVYAFGISCWLLVTDKLPNALLEIPPQKSISAPSISIAASDLPSPVVDILDRSLAPNPTDRPSMAEIRDVISKQLLYGRHRAWITGGHKLETAGQAVAIGSSPTGKIIIAYDGFCFFVRSVEGHVYVNNKMLSPNDELPGSSVITIGPQSNGPNRTFLEFNVSHPVLAL